MSSILWTAVASGAAALILWGVARVVIPRVEPLPAGEELPDTAMQRIARWSLGVSLLFAGVASCLVASFGAERLFSDDGPRIAFELLAVAAMAAAASGAVLIMRRRGSAGEELDERDRAILERAPSVQSLATILALAAWTVALSERFWTVGSMPLPLLQLVFYSCLLVNLLGLPVGVLIGYRRH